jgi:general secretion pathway protein G
MRPPRTRHSARRGFTLIELLVVIAIIAVLVGLTTAAVIRLLVVGPELKDRNDITQLELAVKTFHTKHGVYPPSKVFLSNNRADYNPANPLHNESLRYLSKLCSRLEWSGIDWSGGLGMPTGGVILEGDQCLVFFLGGIPAPGGGTLGFSKDPKNPTKPGGERFRYYEFQAPRLKQLRSGNPFYSYLNAHDEPKAYAYFSSYGRENGYDTVSRLFNPPESDCKSLGVQPYYESAPPASPTVRYVNPKTFQIISAGLDGNFGPGGQWTVATAPVVAAAGRDDISNFHTKVLGAQ